MSNIWNIFEYVHSADGHSNICRNVGQLQIFDVADIESLTFTLSATRENLTSRISIQWFSVCPNIISKCRTIAVLKNFVKENNNLSKTSKYAHYLSMCKTSLV
jgi:hypothetical protein